MRKHQTDLAHHVIVYRRRSAFGSPPVSQRRVQRRPPGARGPPAAVGARGVPVFQRLEPSFSQLFCVEQDAAERSVLIRMPQNRHLQNDNLEYTLVILSAFVVGVTVLGELVSPMRVVALTLIVAGLILMKLSTPMAG